MSEIKFVITKDLKRLSIAWNAFKKSIFTRTS